MTAIISARGLTFPALVTLEDVVEQVRAVAAENPDFVNSGACSYFPHEGAPQGCIVGAACRRLGIKFEHDGNIAEVRLAPLQGDRGALQWLGRVQGLQDDGEAWGYCVERADR